MTLGKSPLASSSLNFRICGVDITMPTLTVLLHSTWLVLFIFISIVNNDTVRKSGQGHSTQGTVLKLWQVSSYLIFTNNFRRKMLWLLLWLPCSTDEETEALHSSIGWLRSSSLSLVALRLSPRPAWFQSLNSQQRHYFVTLLFAIWMPWRDLR